MERAGLEVGLVQVYTGGGKGKTTAALGTALRACGQGLSVWMMQFLKGGRESGERKIAASLPGLTLARCGCPSFVQSGRPSDEDVREAREGWVEAERAVRSSAYDVVILDEINVAVHCGLISADEVVRLIEAKPRNVELVLTGRDARPEVLERADLVSEVVERKHPYRRGISARRGIEY
jgi:cob(I)alamin adenosyltransferase